MFEQPASYAELDAALRRVRHDLKTPMSVIKGYVDMMLRGMGGEPTPAMRRYLERTSDAVRKELALLDCFLASPSGLLEATSEPEGSAPDLSTGRPPAVTHLPNQQEPS